MSKTKKLLASLGIVAGSLIGIEAIQVVQATTASAEPRSGMYRPTYHCHFYTVGPTPICHTH